MSPQEIAIGALIGLVAGLLSGLFGVGGGSIMTPAIAVLLGVPPLTAVATPLPVIAWVACKSVIGGLAASISRKLMCPV